MQGAAEEITVGMSASQERCAFLNYFQKALDIHQNCGIIKMQKEYSKQTEQRQEGNRMANILMIAGRREAYRAEDLLHKTVTVGELIAYLEQFDDDTKVVLNNDNGYTYGSIDYESFEEADEEEEE